MWSDLWSLCIKYICHICAFLIWHYVHLFFSYLALHVPVTYKGIYVILGGTWHRYCLKWTEVPYTEGIFKLMLDKEVQNFQCQIRKNDLFQCQIKNSLIFLLCEEAQMKWTVKIIRVAFDRAVQSSTSTIQVKKRRWIHGRLGTERTAQFFMAQRCGGDPCGPLCGRQARAH